MKNALILNNTHSETDFINILKKNYKKVYTISNSKPYNRKANIKHINCDYKNYKRIKLIQKKYNISDTFPGANDYTLFSLAHLKSKIIDDLSIIKIIHNKELFRNFIKSIKIYTLNILKKKKNFNKIVFPLLAKPTLGHGGKGIVKIEDHKGLKLFIKNIRNKYIIEEFVEGSNHGIFTLVKNQKIIFIFFDTEQRFLNPYTVSSTISSCNISSDVKLKIKKNLSKIIKKLKLKDGIFHSQIIFNKYKKAFYLIEATRRLPGDNYLKFIRYSTGASIEDYILKLFLKKKIKIELKKSSYILRKVLMSSSNGYFHRVRISKKIKKNIIEIIIFKQNGEKINNYLQDRVGVVFLKFKTKKRLLAITKNIDKFIGVIIQKNKF
jgi:biotin carboxylase